MDTLLDRIAGRRAELTGQAERLRKELAEVEAELARMATAEQVVAQLLAEPAGEPGGGVADQAGGQGGGREESRRSPPLAVPRLAGGVTVEDLPGDYQRLMQIVAEEGPVACKRVCAKLGLTGQARHTEGVRVKLKRLVERGWLAETAPGRFTPR